MKRQSLLISALLLVATAAFAGLHTRSGTVYVQNGQFEDAVRELKLAIQEDPKDAKAHFMIAVAYSSLDEKGKQLMDDVATVGLAYEHFTRAKELDPKKARDCDGNIQANYARHYNSGQVAFKQNNVTQAAHEFDLATKADPKQSASFYNLAVSYSRLAQADSTYYAKTLAAADKVLELADPKEPNYERALQLAANQLVYLGKPDEAKARLQKTIDEDPSKYTIVEEMGNELMKYQKWAGASSFLKLAAEGRSAVGADDAVVLKNIGQCEFNLAQTDPAHLDEAITYFDKSIALAPDDAETIFKLMGAHVKKSDWENAAVVGEQYVALAPDDPKGWQLLASCYNEMGQDDKAADALARYATLKNK